ncbi:methyl-accepting chemotaxis protein [Tolumonas lignilytica]|uniref:methyl-accepting chemotaxis protein n=1 Tax=Tolumonas lignilytica TaxID=1283284 RepID=UPI0004640452|nr:methyl-accepting chemotaxis protein [Tolumonas lignilytica]
MNNTRDLGSYGTVSYTIPSNQHESIINRFIANYRFTGKMMLLLGLVILCTIAGNIWNAFSARDVIREEIVHGMINQLTALHAQLEATQQRDPAHFMANARQILTDSRWEQDKSGYAFLVDRQGKLIIYPPDASREGGFLDPVQVEGRDENVNQSFARVGQGNTPESIVYPYVKPGTSERILKVAHVYPMGDYMLVSGVYVDRADKAFADYLKQSGILIVIMLLLIGGVITLFSKAIGQQVKSSLHALNLISRHDLSQKQNINGKDEFAQINHAVEDTRNTLANMLLQQRDMSLSLASASSQMNSGMDQVEHAVRDERQRLDSVAAAMEEMATTIRDVAKNANDASDATRSTDSLAASGVAQIREAIVSMNTLFDNLSTSADSVTGVEQKASVIGSVVDTIRGISEQTNLLALNAAIEAARAGEQGRGFAVVADEVRTLASRTQQATQEIADMISGLQQGTRQAVSLMQNSIDAANTAVENAQKASTGFEQIAEQTSHLAERSEMIAAASEEQGVVANQVTDSLVAIRDSVEETEQVVTELSQASKVLSQHAQVMDEMVRKYTLPAHHH